MTQESTRVEDRPTTLDAQGVLTWARRCVEQLAEHREEINALNVFPVPDSDTGTNLLYTMRAALDRAEGEDAWIAEGGGTAGAREVAVALGRGAVHGARGNSGVILSQVLRAVGEAATFTVVDAATYRRALRTAVTLVDNALSDPVEGTIVTVLREAAAGAGRSTATSLVEVARAAADSAADALSRTTAQLSVLRNAGVVDAGGRGLLILLDTMVGVLTGETPDRPDYGVPSDPGAGECAAGAGTESSDRDDAGGRAVQASTQTRYEVMYSLTHSDDARADELRSALRTLGDSVVVVGDGGAGDHARWAVHVHTDDIGPAIESALSLGRIVEIRVTDMLDPLGEGRATDDAVGTGSAGASPAAARPTGTPTRTVAAVVRPGSLAELFTDAGAAAIDPGDSGEGVIDAVLALEADECVVLPNGELSRAQIGSLDEALRDMGRHALILPTASVVQGLAALAVHDASSTLSLDGFGMADAAAATRHAHLVRAEQDALTLVGRCAAGDLLGVIGHDVALIDSDPVGTVCSIVDRMLTAGGELVTLLLGDEYDEPATENVLTRLRTDHPDVEVVAYSAGPGRILARVGVE
ncbi:DAK2 domain-containing protein [Dietzia aurantiaca]|uniref:DAK2 domain-containing protein n=1 Tax=Dietzia aurantiaca TaxID=983873 RepID=UPI001E4CD26E|nr:DAK2 domain-containing protein [Dietzia aurantiaca]MCD2261638.1 DAK2 domain-containing protein [Dietzia aurantiaca]